MEWTQGHENALRTISDNVREGLSELQQAYPAMLHRLREILLSELQVPNASAPMLAELRVSGRKYPGTERRPPDGSFRHEARAVSWE